MSFYKATTKAHFSKHGKAISGDDRWSRVMVDGKYCNGDVLVVMVFNVLEFV